MTGNTMAYRCARNPLHPFRRCRPVLIGAAAFTLGCEAEAGQMQMPPPPEVAVVTLSPETVPEPFEFPAQVIPYRRVEVRARVDGVIEERAFTEGTIVSAGQVLYRLDRVRYDAAYRSALARFQNAERTLQRLEPLLERRAVAQQDVDNARGAYEAAQGELDRARTDLEDTEIRAGITGRVGRTLLEVGARVTGSGDLLTVIDRLDPVYVTFRPSALVLLGWQRDPDSWALIQRGSDLAVRVVMPDGTELDRTGRLDFVAPALDAATGTRELRARFDNADGRLMPGQFVRVRLEGFHRHEALAVPQRAVLSGLGRQYVYVLGPGDTVLVRNVEPGPWSGERWIIDRGLAAGDRVVVEGVQKVAPGRPVRPVPYETATGEETQ